MQTRLVWFLGVIIFCITVVLVVFLWQQRSAQVRAVLLVEQERLRAEVEQIRESAERIAHSLPVAIFDAATGPYEYVDDFTRALELYGMDVGWILSERNGDLKPWIDGRKRLVLNDARSDFATRVAQHLKERPWPQAREGNGRSYWFFGDDSEKRMSFLEVFPIYHASSRVGFLLVGRGFSSESALGESLRRAVWASAGAIVNLGVEFNGKEIFKATESSTVFLSPILRSEPTTKVALTGENPDFVIFRAYVETRDLWVTICIWIFVNLMMFGIGIFAIGIWTRKSVRNTLVPLEDLVQGTSQLTAGNFAVRVREPVEEELLTLAQKFNFLAASLESTLANLAQVARKEEEARRHAIEAEVIQLRAQLQPHFLFNSLSMVAQTILDNPTGAYEMTLALANLFHSILRSSEKFSHVLEEELEIVDSYLHLQSMRFEGRLTYSMPSRPFLFSIQVPPLVLQNLVENAVKHGIAPLRSGGHISIRLETLDSCRNIVVENNGVPIPSEFVEGTGVKNTRRRWCLLHGDKANLELCVTSKSLTQSVLSVPFEAEDEA